MFAFRFFANVRFPEPDKEVPLIIIFPVRVSLVEKFALRAIAPPYIPIGPAIVLGLLIVTGEVFVIITGPWLSDI